MTSDASMTARPSLPRRIVAEAIGTALLVATVIGSGVMGERLAGGNVAIALLANTIATGAGLVALILTFGSISGAHFNPVVTLADASQGGVAWRDVMPYIIAQIGGAFAGAACAHLMFSEPLFSASHHVRRDGSDRERVRRDIRLAVGHLGLQPRATVVDPVRRWSLHFSGVLVHVLDLVREPRGDAGPRRQRHVRRDTPDGCARFHRCAGLRRGRVDGPFSVAHADVAGGRQSRGRSHFGGEL